MSALAVWWVSLVRSFTGWDVSSAIYRLPPLTPAHGWLLPAPAAVAVQRTIATPASCGSAAESRRWS